MHPTTLTACHECDLLQWRVVLPERRTVRCGRCDAVLYRIPPAGFERPLAFTVAAAVLFMVACAFPMVGLWIRGELVETTLIGAALSMYAQGEWPIAGLVLVTTILMPLLSIAATLYLLLPMRSGYPPRGLRIVSRLLRHASPWAMIEVLMLGMLVALVKLRHFATIVPGTALWAFGAVMLLLAAVGQVFDLSDVWARAYANAAHGLRRRVSRATTAGAPGLTAARAGLCLCHDCGLLSETVDSCGQSTCPRCGAFLHPRKRDSLARSWAFLLAAIALYVPAMTFPVMVTTSLGRTQGDTIMSGVVFLWMSGSWSLAAVVFIASIVVPMLKILSLVYLVSSTQLRTSLIPKERTRIYRIIESVGRWSMLDIYVITILVALIRFDQIATIAPGPGVIAFGAVVVLTMLASLSFDPRLIWDAMEAEGE
ncbi:paraquat-inducible protein A [Paraburkholderia tropica]|uniref:paraquat-inducible protein A n=1 Tax=Paraburkholderia tropica TaxID=92647 RepID=UPI002AB5FE6A|nr:paraquat-inducible protein A [Paraburkholderia tropica]